jgi:hypothetical protein
MATGRALIESMQRMINEIPALIGDRVELLSLELKRAGQAVKTILMLVVAAAVLGVIALIALWAIGVLLLIRLGLAPELALLIAAVLNGALVAWMLWSAKSLVPVIGLPATRRRLSFHLVKEAADQASATEHEPIATAASTSAAAAATATATATAKTAALHPRPQRAPMRAENESADPVGDGRSDADFAATMPGSAPERKRIEP